MKQTEDEMEYLRDRIYEQLKLALRLADYQCGSLASRLQDRYGAESYFMDAVQLRVAISKALDFMADLLRAEDVGCRLCGNDLCEDEVFACDSCLLKVSIYNAATKRTTKPQSRQMNLPLGVGGVAGKGGQ